MNPLLLLILVILNFSRNNDSCVLENKGSLIQETKTVQTILPIVAFFFLFCCPTAYNRENRSSNPITALTMLVLIILVFGNNEKLRKGVSRRPPGRPYRKPPVYKPITQGQKQLSYSGKNSMQHGLNALTILILILLQYGEGRSLKQDNKKPISNRPMTRENSSRINENEPNTENLLLTYLSILAALNLKDTEEPAKDIRVRIIDKRDVVENHESTGNPQGDAIPLLPLETCETEQTSPGFVTIPVCEAVTYPTAQDDEDNTETDTDFVDAIIEEEEVSLIETAPLEEAPILEAVPEEGQETDSMIQEIKDASNSISDAEQDLPEVSSKPEIEKETKDQKEVAPLVPIISEAVANASGLDTPMASMIKSDYEGSFITTLLSNLVAAGGEVVFHFNHIISLKFGDRIYFINDKDLLGFY